MKPVSGLPPALQALLYVGIGAFVLAYVATLHMFTVRRTQKNRDQMLGYGWTTVGLAAVGSWGVLTTRLAYNWFAGPWLAAVGIVAAGWTVVELTRGWETKQDGARSLVWHIAVVAVPAVALSIVFLGSSIWSSTIC